MTDDEDLGALPPQVLLTYAIDAINECRQLIKFGQPTDQARRRWWQSAFLRSSAHVVADQRLMYLNENVDRARDHWQRADDLIGQLATVARGDDLIDRLVADLVAAGFGEIAPRLRHGELPGPVPEVIAHLDAVHARLGEYSAMLADARRQLSHRDRPNDDR